MIFSQSLRYSECLHNLDASECALGDGSGFFSKGAGSFRKFRYEVGSTHNDSSHGWYDSNKPTSCKLMD
jgi:hypothetical protein